MSTSDAQKRASAKYRKRNVKTVTINFYPNDPVVITISHLGYIKRTPLADFKEQALVSIRSAIDIH